jgi:predicted double-glycine peptidase
MDEITIRDNNFEILRIIDDPGQLAKARKQWNTLVRIKEPPNTNWTHKIDIESSSRFLNDRWLYNKEGYIARLNYQLKPMYKVSDVKLFNEIYLGP